MHLNTRYKQAQEGLSFINTTQRQTADDTHQLLLILHWLSAYTDVFTCFLVCTVCIVTHSRLYITSPRRHWQVWNQVMWPGGCGAYNMVGSVTAVLFLDLGPFAWLVQCMWWYIKAVFKSRASPGEWTWFNTWDWDFDSSPESSVIHTSVPLTLFPIMTTYDACVSVF